MLHRRNFLKAAAVTVFSGNVAPAILGAEDKAGTRPPVLGQEEFQFTCHHDWGELPSHLQWRNTHGVAIDNAGFVYVTHQGAAKSPCDTVVVFDPEGSFVRSFGKEFAGGGHGIDIRKEADGEFLYLCDILNRQIIKCDTQGEWVWKQRYPRTPNRYQGVNEFRPTNVCFAPNGDFYVADGYGAHLIHQYNLQGNWVRTWGGEGIQAGKLKTPHGLWLDQRTPEAPSLVIADRANARLQYFTLDGNPVNILQGVKGVTSEEPPPLNATLPDVEGNPIPVTPVVGLSFPASIDIWEEIMVVADLHARLLLFDGENTLLANLGYDEAWTQQVLAEPSMRTQKDKWQPGRFIHPHDACFDADGNLYVTEWVEPGRVSMLKWL